MIFALEILPLITSPHRDPLETQVLCLGLIKLTAISPLRSVNHLCIRGKQNGLSPDPVIRNIFNDSVYPLITRALVREKPA